MALSKAKREWCVEQVRLGRSVFDLAAELGTSPSQVRWALKGSEVAAQAKADRLQRGRFSPSDAAEVIRLYSEEGLSGHKIAERFGVTHNTVTRLLQRHGVNRRRGWAKDPTERKCSKCQVVKPMGAFGQALTRPEWKFRTYECRDCSRKKYRERGYSLKNNTGIEVSQYDAMLADQGGTCAICGTAPGTQRFAVDHDHGTNAIRWLLCQRCNTSLERVENAVWMARAMEYLVQPPAAHRELVFSGRNVSRETSELGATD